MLTFPTLPTDSLYKFIFIAGVVLVVTSTYMMPRISIENLNEEVRLDSLQIMNHFESNVVKDSANEIERVLKKYDEETDSLIKTNGKIANLRERYNKDVVPTKSQFKRLARKQMAYTIDSLFKDNRKKMNEKFYQMNNHLLKNIFVLGWLLVSIGGVFWYLCIQQPQDELLKIQLVEARKKTDNSKEIKVRKHFEPQTLPRPQLRNRV